MSIPAPAPLDPKLLMEYGHEWEDHVISVISRWKHYTATWHGMRHNIELRTVLRGTASTERHAPDIAVRTPDGKVIWVECVRSDPSATGNHAIQLDKVIAQKLWADSHPSDLLVVAFTSYIAGVIGWASIAKIDRLGQQRPFKGRGSGTPFVVFPAQQTCVGNYPQALLDAACQI